MIQRTNVRIFLEGGGFLDLPIKQVVLSLATDLLYVAGREGETFSLVPANPLLNLREGFVKSVTIPHVWANDDGLEITVRRVPGTTR